MGQHPVLKKLQQSSRESVSPKFASAAHTDNIAIPTDAVLRYHITAPETSRLLSFVRLPETLE